MHERTALVTGCSRGIGMAICRKLAVTGFYIYMNCRKKNDNIEGLLSEIISIGGKGKILEFDIRDKDQIQKARKKFIHDNINLLVNNAGILKDNLLYEVELDSWNDIIQTNFFGAVSVFDEWKSILLKSDNPVVINIGSISGVRPRKGQGAYSVSKAMIIEWTKQQALVYKGIRFYVISPGPVATDMIKSAPWYTDPGSFKRIPLARFTEPEEIAGLIHLLADNVHLFINGTNIIFDGGFTQTIKE
ncbi:MAG: SDR family oxidoreductase [Spirochaetales bacterium]|nr:SDR family oxidoreductase [Spirochaetales bacterium]